MTPWEHFTTLRDEQGTIVLEEVDEDTATATFRVHARRSVTARLVADEVRFEGEPPPALRAALTAPPPREPAAAPPPSPREPAPLASSPGAAASEPGSRRAAWVAAGVACGVAAIAAWRRR